MSGVPADGVTVERAIHFARTGRGGRKGLVDGPSPAAPPPGGCPGWPG